MTCHLRHFLMIETNQNLFLLNLVSMEKVEVLPILRIGSFFLFCASFSACALALSYCSIAPFFLPKKNNVYIMLHLRASNKHQQRRYFHVPVFHNRRHISYSSKCKARHSGNGDLVLVLEMVFHFLTPTVFFFSFLLTSKTHFSLPVTILHKNERLAFLLIKLLQLVEFCVGFSSESS